MTVSDVENQVLRLLDEVGATDYVGRMFKLIDEAQREIACSWGFIRRSWSGEVTAGVPVALPEDVYAIERADNGDFELEPVKDGEGEWCQGIVFPESGTRTLIYKAYPDTITDNDGSKKIQLAPEYHTALCCYVAALTQHNEYDKRAYQIFMERYNNCLLQITAAKQMTGRARVITNGRII